MTSDLTSRVAELAASIEANLTGDEATALATIGINERADMIRGTPPPRWVAEQGGSGITSEDRYSIIRVRHTWARERDHIIRNDPARVLCRVKAARELVAAILAERHADSERDSPYSCARVLGPGKPCDCGRDARVARLLGIIAGEWNEEGA